ncbi:hypothetical protein CsatB_000417 [Cannabis sativa]
MGEFDRILGLAEIWSSTGPLWFDFFLLDVLQVSLFIIKDFLGMFVLFFLGFFFIIIQVFLGFLGGPIFVVNLILLDRCWWVMRFSTAFDVAIGLNGI